MTLRDYVLVFARNWVVVAVTVVAGLVTAGAVAFTSPTTYETSAKVLFTGHDTGSGQDLAYVGAYVQSRMATYSTLDGSTELLEAAAEEIGGGETAETLRPRIDIEVSERETVAVVVATDETAAGAARAADAVAVALLDSVARVEPEFASSPTDRGDSSTTTIMGTVTQEAVVPGAPVAPDFSMHLLVGALGGLLVSAAVIVYREAWRGDQSSSGAEDG